MVETIAISKTKVSESRLKTIDFVNLPFGKVFTDHMFLADFRQGEWSNFRIVPFGYMPISPASPALHYGQSIFEGIKAYASESNKEALVFRPLDNWKRMNISAERMCMPFIPEELFMDSMSALIDLDRAWIPREEGSSLYIRPFMFSADEYIGIRPSQDFTFMVILSPTGPYYSAPVKVKIETHYTRAVEGGTGFAKAGGNYGGAIFPAKLAQDQGYHQLIWTDGKNHEYVEESGTMNLMFVIDGVLVTPALSDSILAGVTRQSVLDLARHWKMPVEERRVAIKELVKALEEKRVSEAFGVGTAATIAQIELIGYQGKDHHLPEINTRKFSNRVYEELERIKRGKTTDLFNWVHRI
jgi:branched-chain amino acid aminotransferase